MFQNIIYIILLCLIMKLNLCISMPNKINLDLHVEEETQKGFVLKEIDPLVNKDISSRVHRKYRIISQNLLTKNTHGDIVTNRYKRVDILKINERSGTLRLSKTVDREELCPTNTGKCVIRAQIVVLPQKHFQLIETDVTIDDINDNAPEFPHEVVHLNISENWSLADVINLDSFQAKDRDIGNNSKLEYSLTPNSYIQLKYFIDDKESSHLQLYLLKKLDYEESSLIEMSITASDFGIPQSKKKIDVKIHVIDENDNPPVFEKEEYTATLKENASPGSTVTVVRAHDADNGLFGSVRYSISSRNQQNIRNLIEIDEKTGVVSLKETTDREGHTGLRVLIEATDMDPVNPKTGETWLVIHVEDVNDNFPTIIIDFISQHVEKTVYLSETSPEGTYMARVTSTDSDSGHNGRVELTLSTHSECENMRSDHFILTRSGFLESRYTFDRELCNKYNIAIKACDHGIPQRCTNELITVIILDVNEFSPKIQTPLERVVVSEDAYLGTIIATIAASDGDAINGPAFTRNESEDIVTSKNGDVFYSIIDVEEMPFTIGKKSGKIRLMTQLDRELKSEWKLKISVKDGGSPPMENFANVIVEVDDVNDNHPVFVNPSANNSVVYVNVLERSSITKVKAIDADSGLNAKIVYSLSEYLNKSQSDSIVETITAQTHNGKTMQQDSQHYFIINPNTGDLCLNFSRKNVTDSIGTHFLRIRAKDSGTPSLFSDIFLQVVVGKYPSQNLLSDPRQLFSNSVDPFIVTVALGSSVLLLLGVAIIITVKCRLMNKNIQPNSNAFTPNQRINGISKFGSRKSSRVTFYDEIEERRQRVMTNSQESLDAVPTDTNEEINTKTNDEESECNHQIVNASVSNHSDSDSGRGDSDMDTVGTCISEPREHQQIKQHVSRCGEHCRIYGHSDMCWMPANENVTLPPNRSVQPITIYDWERLKPTYFPRQRQIISTNMAYSASSLLSRDYQQKQFYSYEDQIQRQPHRAFERRHSNPCILEKQPHFHSRKDLEFSSPQNQTTHSRINFAMLCNPPPRAQSFKRAMRVEKMSMNSSNIVCNLDTVYESDSLSRISSDKDLSELPNVVENVVYPVCSHNSRDEIIETMANINPLGQENHDDSTHGSGNGPNENKTLSMRETQDILNNIDNLLL